MLGNPIIRKEVLGSLRTRKAVIMQAMFLLAQAALLALLWPAGGVQDLDNAQAHQVLNTLALGELVLVALFAPAFTAASLTSEVERRTFESLFTTRLTPWQITFGKMAGALTFLLLLVISGAPALSVPFLLGGVSGVEVLAVLGVLLLTAVYLGLIGMLVSSMMHRSYRAIIVTYAILMVVCFLVAMPVWPISGTLISRGGPTFQKIVHTLASLSPVQAMLSVVMPNSDYVTAAKGMPPYWQMFIPVSIAVIIFTAIWLLIKLRRPIAPPRPREKLKVVERGQISARTFLFLIDPRKRKGMISWWQNPVLIKEFRTRPMLQAQWLMRAVLTALIVSVVLMFLVSLSVQMFVGENSPTGLYTSMATVVSALMVLTVILIGPAVSGGTICADIETGVWDLMRSTRLSSWRIVSGKFQASIIPLLLLAVAMLPALGLLLYFEASMLENLLWVAAVVGMSIMFVVTAGTFFSSIFSRTATATAWTYALVVALTLVTMLALLAGDRFSSQLMETVFTVNPIAAAMGAAGYPPMQKMNLVNDHLRLMGIATAVAFIATVVRVVQLRRAK
jgi:ABC-type transport system involved in multi-copper enzyme maturation permease subunit